MRNVSNGFKSTMETRRDFYSRAVFTFPDGDSLTLGKSEFSISGNGIVDGAGSNAFPLGAVIAKQVTFSINNDRGQYADYSFYGASVVLYLCFDIESGTEELKIGTFYVVSPETYGSTITLQAMDDIHKLDITYTTSLSFPATLGELMVDACGTCGVTLATSVFPNSDFAIKKKPSGITFRDFVGNVAMLAGGNAKMDEENRLYIVPYDFSEGFSILDGGVFDDGEPQYKSGSKVDGGTFNPWNDGYQHNDGNFTEVDDVHVLSDFKPGMTIGTDDVVITGVKLTSGQNEYLHGAEGYALSLSNDLVDGDEQAAVDLIGNAVVGIRFRPFSGDHIAYPLAESMDYAYITDRNKTIYSAVLTDVNFEFFGHTTLKCAADTPIRNNADYSNAATKAEQAARKESQRQLSAYEQTATNMMQLISQGFGLYFTTVELADGSTKAYMHDKAALEESSVIWTLTSTGLMVSKDKGLTFALDANGNALFNVITARGINADWINTGTLSVGGNGYMGRVRILNDSGAEVGSLSTSGITAKAGNIGGFYIGDTSLYKIYDSGKSETGVGTGSDTSKFAFWAGESNGAYGGAASDAKFRVDHGGGLYAEAAIIKGHVEASSGSFAGEVNASSGTFDSVTVNGSTWSGGSVTSASIGSPVISGGSYSGGALSGGSYSSGSMYSCSVPSGSALYMGGQSNYIDYQDGGQVRITAGGQAGVALSGVGGIFIRSGNLSVVNNAYITGALSVSGSKNRAVKTKSYGTRALAAYETPFPTFADYGKGQIGEDGLCCLAMDPVFMETVGPAEPVVFLTKYGQGDIWVDEISAENDKIIIKGTPGLKFAWEARYEQAGIDTERLAVIENNAGDIDYGVEAADYMAAYERSITDGY